MSSHLRYTPRLSERIEHRLRRSAIGARVQNWVRYREACRATRNPCPSPAYAEDIAAERLKVLFISPMYSSTPSLVVSLLEQTYRNWELLLVHDGPFEQSSALTDSLLKDSRVHFTHTPHRFDDWGHTPRKLGFQVLETREDVDFVVITNSDNYHVPGFVRMLLEAFTPEVVASYCDMVHNTYFWRQRKTRLVYSHIDCGCLMVRRNAALQVGWKHTHYEADWDYIAGLLNVFGPRAFRKVPAALFVHN